MARDLTTAAENAILASNVLPVWFAELHFDSGIERFSTAHRDITFGGNLFSALGHFGGVSEINEASDLSANGVILRLSGVPVARVSQALSEKVQGRTAKLWSGFLDPDTHALIADPAGPFTFRMDNFAIHMGESATITLACESRAILWSKTTVRRYTDADQQSIYPGDRLFEFVAKMSEKELIWPGKGWAQLNADRQKPPPPTYAPSDPYEDDGSDAYTPPQPDGWAGSGETETDYE